MQEVYPVSAGTRESAEMGGAITARQIDRDPERKYAVYTEITVYVLAMPDVIVDEIIDHVGIELGEDRDYVQPRVSELIALDVLTKSMRKKPSLRYGRSSSVHIPSEALLDHVQAMKPTSEGDLRIIVRGFVQSRIIAIRSARRLSRRG